MWEILYLEYLKQFAMTPAGSMAEILFLFCFLIIFFSFRFCCCCWFHFLKIYIYILRRSVWHETSAYQITEHYTATHHPWHDVEKSARSVISFSIHGSFYLLLARLPTRMKSVGGKGAGAKTAWWGTREANESVSQLSFHLVAMRYAGKPADPGSSPLRLSFFSPKKHYCGLWTLSNDLCMCSLCSS